MNTDDGSLKVGIWTEGIFISVTGPLYIFAKIDGVASHVIRLADVDVDRTIAALQNVAKEFRQMKPKAKPTIDIKRKRNKVKPL